MAERVPYAYAALQVVPSIERGERINVGVVLHARAKRFLAVRIAVDETRLHLLAPNLDRDAVRVMLDSIRLVAEGDPRGGEIALLPAPERFGWITAPASTVVQPGPVHGGATDDPARELEQLFRRLVITAE